MQLSSNIVTQRAKPYRAVLAMTQVITLLGALVGAITPDAGGVVATWTSDEAAAAAQISGVVFRDFNNNGLMDTGGVVVDTGVAGVEVRAFAPGAAQSAASALTDRAGAYVLNGLIPGAPYRVEFRRLPAGASPAPHGVPGAARASGTTVQFVSAGSAQVNLGLNAPCDYCQDNPWVVLPAHRNGQPVAGTILGSYAGLFAFPYSATRANTQQLTVTHLSSIGSVWGSAYLRDSRTVLVSAFAKRHAGFGPLGIGGIYAIALKDARTPAQVAVKPFVKLSDLGVDVGVSPRAVGELPIHAGTPNRDSAMFDAVGKIGIGGIDASLDGRVVWAVNLKQRTLLKLRVHPEGVALAGTVPMPASVTCPRGILRPFAVKAHLAHVYVGATCTAENGGSAADLRAYVFRHDPAGAEGNMSAVLSFPLNYPRGAALDRNAISASWNPWIDAWQDIPDPTRGPDDAYTVWPQPVLSSIAFDFDGTMVLGLMDRLSHQGGNVNYSPVRDDKGFYSTVAAGDVLRACLEGGAYVLENNGACGGVRGGRASTGQGPGGGEYYYGDGYFQSHDEVALGSLALLPGVRDLGVVAVNPDDSQTEGTVFQQGMRWLSHTAGASTRAFQLRGIGGYNDVSVFGKASGQGDAELLCDPAPVEIGNRVWFDANGDGVQDAGEAPLEGVSVLLTLADGVTHTAVTNAQGEYFFSSAIAGSRPHARYGVPFVSGAPFTLSVDAAQTPIAGFELTTPNADGRTDNDALDDVRDSDAIARARVYEITGVAGRAGENNHSYDIGLRPRISPTAPPMPTPTATPLPSPMPNDAGLGDYVWLDADQDGLQDPDEEPVGGITVTLLVTRAVVASEAGGMRSAGAIVGRRQTDAQGLYEFRGLQPGVPYLVCFTLPPGLAWTLPETFVDGALGSDADTITSCTQEVTLGVNEFNPNVDAGLIPAVAIEKVGTTSNRDGSVGADAVITYTLKVWNLTEYRVNSVVVTDALPSMLRYVPGSASPAPVSESPLTWIFPTLRPSEIVTITLQTHLIDLDSSVIHNIAYVNQYTTPVSVDSSTVVRNPTVVQLERFDASAIEGGVRLSWRTIAEANTLGFHLYRGATPDRAVAVRITAVMQMSANAAGADYRYDDIGPLAEPGSYYWLEETELGGRTVSYGPVRAAPHSEAHMTEATGVPASALQPLAPYQPIVESAEAAPAQSAVTGQALVLATATPPAQSTTPELPAPALAHVSAQEAQTPLGQATLAPHAVPDLGQIAAVGDGFARAGASLEPTVVVDAVAHDVAAVVQIGDNPVHAEAAESDAPGRRWTAPDAHAIVRYAGILWLLFIAVVMFAAFRYSRARW